MTPSIQVACVVFPEDPRAGRAYDAPPTQDTLQGTHTRSEPSLYASETELVASGTDFGDVVAVHSEARRPITVAPVFADSTWERVPGSWYTHFCPLAPPPLSALHFTTVITDRPLHEATPEHLKRFPTLNFLHLQSHAARRPQPTCGAKRSSWRHRRIPSHNPNPSQQTSNDQALVVLIFSFATFIHPYARPIHIPSNDTSVSSSLDSFPEATPVSGLYYMSAHGWYSSAPIAPRAVGTMRATLASENDVTTVLTTHLESSHDRIPCAGSRGILILVRRACDAFRTLEQAFWLTQKLEI
ncbi:hypothetical protein C8F01DRAFT_1263603 [Mycena amicta]|nr:hypothetical protein C8F01DRAFT_1263603 [Mycena amicta]